jgi:Leucine-rich repeat (LRR) protein
MLVVCSRFFLFLVHGVLLLVSAASYGQPRTYALERSSLVHHKQLTKAVAEPQAVYVLALGYFDDARLREWSKHPRQLAQRLEGIAALHQLRELRLDYLPLTCLPEALVTLSRVETVVLSRMNYLQWDEALVLLARMPNLRHLVVQDCPTLATATRLPCLPHLRTLRISSSPVPAPAAAAWYLPAAEALTLENNALTRFPPSLRALPQVQVVNVLFNQSLPVDSLLQGLASLPGLRELNLSQNNYRSLPPNLSALSSLTVLRINEGGMVQFPRGVAQLQHLRELNLADTNIPPLSPSLLDSLHLYIPYPNNSGVLRRKTD